MLSPSRLAVVAALLMLLGVGTAQKPADEFATTIKPLVAKYCLSCHAAKGKKGGLDLERFATLDHVRKDLKPWQLLIEQIEAGEMPPKDEAQPSGDEKRALLAWTRRLLDTEARARAGDPGFVPLRRLSNAEYDATVRDLTGVDLRPTREFPADGAAGEGFTNAAEALTDVSPTLLNKYLLAAKAIADHVVLLPDGLRFSPSTTRRDWTDEGTARLRAFYAEVASGEGRLNVAPYLAATVTHREALTAGKVAVVAARTKLNAKYLAALFAAMNDRTPSEPLDAIRARWRDGKDVSAELAATQATLWRTVKVGNYIQAGWHASGGYRESLTRQVANDPQALATVPLRLAVKPGAADVVLHLAADGSVVWHRPRFEAEGQAPLLLRDYARFGPAFEADLPSAFADAAKYLDAVRGDKAAGLDEAFLKNWAKLLATKDDDAPLTALDERSPNDPAQPWVRGWRKKGTDLPALVANSSNEARLIPGRVAARGVSMHPTPQEFVAVTWTSPADGAIKVTARVAHAHPACGNGVAWRLEHRGGRTTRLGGGALDLGKEGRLAATAVSVKKGDVLVLAVDARDGNHVCDMTEVEFTVTDAKGKTWSLGADVSGDVQASNPIGPWGFARGPSAKTAFVPPESLLGRWRAEPALAKQVQALLSGPRPTKDGPDRVLYDRLVVPNGPLFVGVDVAKLAKPRETKTFGLAPERFDGDGIAVKEIEVRVPAALMLGREFVVEAKASGDNVTRVRVTTERGGRWDGPVLANPSGAAYRRLIEGNDAFRRVFPLFVCFPPVVPTDEVVTLKMFHREDEPLVRLFLDAERTARLERLWVEHRFVSRQPVAENDYLPQFMGYTTQDTPKEFQQFFIDRKPRFEKEAKAFEAEERTAEPRHVDALLAFADRAYRRPVSVEEKAALRGLYKAVRDKGASHIEAVRGVLTRVLVSPAFLFRVEKAPSGKDAGPVSDTEFATRLSYFLWSSLPDDELRRHAAAGTLRRPDVLSAQVKRMVADARVRSLAVEFGTQWVHVRGFDEHNEKSEKHFPTFTPELRRAMYEEAILFFQDVFQADRRVTHVLDADATFLNEPLARHYGVPGVSGPAWRRVEGMRAFGRGGVLGLAAVQAKQSGASRTSPVLRGNWVVETLLGEKLPKPPADVPQLPQEEGGPLTVRQQVERHAKDPACAVCHVRIDPYGFALEAYDPIGRRRAKDLGGLPIDAKAKLRDGTAFEGIDGLRDYLLTKKKDTIVRLFCRRLLGYALGRAVTLSDEALIDEMVAEVRKNDGRVSAALMAVVRSKPFGRIRGGAFGE